MKKTLLIALAVLVVGLANAQDGNSDAEKRAAAYQFIASGGFLFGGTIGFNGNSSKFTSSSSTSDGPKTSNLNITPLAGYVLNRMLILGLSLGYISTLTKTITQDFDGNDIELKDKSNQFVFQPGIAFYKQMITNLYFVTTFYLGLGFGSSTKEFYDSSNGISSYKDKLSSFRMGLIVSFAYFLATSWALTLSYGNFYFNSTKQTDSEDSNNYNKSINYGLDLSLATLQLGIIFYLASQNSQ
jgi:hypothetical protein